MLYSTFEILCLSLNIILYKMDIFENIMALYVSQHMTKHCNMFFKILCEFSLQCLFKYYHEFRLHHILFYLKVTLSYNDEWHYLSTDLVFIMYWSIRRESLTGQSYFIQTRKMITYDNGWLIVFNSNVYNIFDCYFLQILQ